MSKEVGAGGRFNIFLDSGLVSGGIALVLGIHNDRCPTWHGYIQSPSFSLCFVR